MYGAVVAVLLGNHNPCFIIGGYWYCPYSIGR